MRAHNVAALEELLKSNNIDLQSLPLKMLSGPFVVSDPRLDDMPIIYVCDNFCALTGYDRSEIEGRNCRFLQYKDGVKKTEEEQVQHIRDLIKKGEEGLVKLTNYTKSGTSFQNVFSLIPLRDKDSKEIVLYFGGQTLTDSGSVPLKRASKRDDGEKTNVYYKCGNDVRKPNRLPVLPFENGHTKGNVLLKTVTDPLDKNVAEYFQGRNRLFEVQAQFELKKPIPEGHNVFICIEVENGVNVGWVTKLICKSILGMLRLFTSKMHHSFGDDKEKGHFVFPFNVLPDQLECAPDVASAAKLTMGDLKTKGSEKKDIESLEMGCVYTLNFYSQYMDMEEWTIAKLPGMSNTPLTTFWQDSPIHVMLYSLPPNRSHKTVNRQVLLDIEIGNNQHAPGKHE